MKKPVLKSKATNAYDLLRDVCRVIAEEPRRYYQDLFMVRSKRRIREILRRGGSKVEPPMCGTMACRAGWIVQLHDGRAPLFSMDISDRALEILGAQEYDNFLIDVDTLFASGVVGGVVGTRAYAREGVKGLRAFMAKHRKRLKATTFSGRPEAS